MDDELHEVLEWTKEDLLARFAVSEPAEVIQAVDVDLDSITIEDCRIDALASGWSYWRQVREVAEAADRQWFSDHPDQCEYQRPVVDHEFWPRPHNGMVLVRKLAAGVRTRAPVLKSGTIGSFVGVHDECPGPPCHRCQLLYVSLGAWGPASIGATNEPRLPTGAG